MSIKLDEWIYACQQCLIAKGYTGDTAAAAAIAMADLYADWLPPAQAIENMEKQSRTMRLLRRLEEDEQSPR